MARVTVKRSVYIEQIYSLCLVFELKNVLSWGYHILLGGSAIRAGCSLNTAGGISIRTHLLNLKISVCLSPYPPPVISCWIA